MKRRIFAATLVAILALGSYIAVQYHHPGEKISNVTLANIEALANDEAGQGKQCRWKRVFDSHGCQYWNCVENGDGNICECGSTDG